MMDIQDTINAQIELESSQNTLEISPTALKISQNAVEKSLI